MGICPVQLKNKDEPQRSMGGSGDESAGICQELPTSLYSSDSHSIIKGSLTELFRRQMINLIDFCCDKVFHEFIDDEYVTDPNFIK